jgi:hypothetical protein
LRRLPAVVRELRWRQTDLPPFQVQDERDLEDLLRALLALHFEDVRPLSRTPTYSTGTRTEFLLAPEQTVVVVKIASRHGRPCPDLAAQFAEDGRHHRDNKTCRRLVGFVYDPEGVVREPAALERAWSSGDDELDMRCVIAAASSANCIQP